MKNSSYRKQSSITMNELLNVLALCVTGVLLDLQWQFQIISGLEFTTTDQKGHEQHIRQVKIH